MQTFMYPHGRQPASKRPPASKDFIYRFRPAGPEEPVSNATMNYRVEKWQRGVKEDGTNQIPKLSATYHVWGDDEESLLCDCPGAMYHSDKEGLGFHKHTLWLKEWLELTTLGGMPENIYFDPTTERFHPTKENV